MILTCNECNTSFNFNESLLKETGSKVRCSKCNNIFVAYPKSNAIMTDGEGKTLEEIDLSEIKNILGMDKEQEVEGISTEETGELDLDLGEIEGEDDSGSALGPEKTEEINMSEFENILEEDDKPAEESVSAEEPSELDFELDLDLGEIEGEDDSGSVLGPEKTEEIDMSEFENILEEDDKLAETSLSTEEPDELDLDFDINLDSEEVSDDVEAGPEPAETVEFDMSDMEDVLGVEDELEKESESAKEEDLDFELELDFGGEKGQDDKSSKDQLDVTEELDLSGLETTLELEEEPVLESQAGEGSGELDLDIDLDLEEVPDDAGAGPEMDETVEFDMSDMEDVLGVEDEPIKESESAKEEDLDFDLDLGFGDEKDQDDTALESELAEAEVSDDLDFELDLDIGEDKAPDAAVSEFESEEIEELDLSEAEEVVGAENKQADEEVFAVELQDAEELDLTDLDSVLEVEETQTGEDDSAEEPGELDLELDLETDPAEASDDAESEIQFETTEEFDLSDLDKMLDDKDQTGTQNAEDVELKFEIEGSAQDALSKAATIDEQTIQHKEEGIGDTFDLGTLKDEPDAEGAESSYTEKKERAPRKKMKPVGKRRLSGPMRILLVLVLLVGGVYGGHTVLTKMGIDIPFEDTIRNIPFVGDLLKPKVKDTGNLYVNIIERKVVGSFVDNSKIGTLFVITGQIRNEYNHPRRFIKVKGRIYKKGKVLFKTKTVYCGNVLSEKELASLNQAAITKRLNNRLGDKRSNMKVEKGRILPFMIVFSKAPDNLEEFTVEVAGSSK